MTEHPFDRRDFLRAASLAAIGVATGCSNSRTPVGNPTGTATGTPGGSGSPSPTPTASLGKAAWIRVDAKGPKARSFHTFTANADGSIVFLFGGKTKGRVFKDAWAYERSNGLWQPLDYGPEPRYGHSAAFVDGHLLIFGGRDETGRLFNDAWAFDPVHGAWVKLNTAGARPAARWGAAGTTIAKSLTISHGLVAAGRADDTWALSTRWNNVTPRGLRPAKRAFHRAVYASGLTRMVLFGGLAGSALAGDTWLYDPTVLHWTQAKVPGPAPRHSFAACATKSHAYLYGGTGRAGPLRDAWAFDGRAWRALKPSGPSPGLRTGTEGAAVSGPGMLVFGGNDGRGDLDDLWELTLPA